MKVADFVKISRATLILLSKYGIKVDDFKYIDLYSEYCSMVSQGDKVSYAVAVLARKYSISESSVYRKLKLFKATI